MNEKWTGNVRRKIEGKCQEEEGNGNVRRKKEGKCDQEGVKRKEED